LWDQFNIGAAPSSTDHPTKVLKQGDAFGILGGDGDIRCFK
jgi:hypothetical protein